MAHDFLGNELSIGDDVVFLTYNRTSASLERGKITKVSEHAAEINGKRRAEYKIVKVNPVKPTMDNTWIPCSERIPEDGQDVLIWDNIDKTSFTGHYVWCDGWTVDGYAVNRFHFDITHWMPLPEPPKEGDI